MALIRGTRGWDPRRGRKATRSRTTPKRAGSRHAGAEGQEEIDLPGGQEQDRHKGPEHIDLSLGEVDQAQDAIDHGVAQGDQGVNTAGGETVEQLLEKHRI